jgi:hypothetical protein
MSMNKKGKTEDKVRQSKIDEERKKTAILLRDDEGVVRRVKYEDWVKVDPETKTDDWIVSDVYTQLQAINPHGLSRSAYSAHHYWPLSAFIVQTPHHGYTPFDVVPITSGLLHPTGSLGRVVEAIAEALPITELPENWDEQGALPISRDTWGKAINLLMEYAGYIAEHYLLTLSAPQIDAVPDGSIDLFWKEPKAQLLINVKPGTAIAGFYGDTYTEDDKIKGKIPLEGIKEYLAVWMKNLSY